MEKETARLHAAIKPNVTGSDTLTGGITLDSPRSGG